jgi:FAD/FMN-containing dehydrogenase
VYGLACTGGRVSTTGIAGLTLGSGSGWLERALGLTADSLVAADVVTADGSVVRASEDENADLFWGLRGGTGNFGIVTSFEYGLYEVGPYLNAGLLLYSLDDAERVLRQWREFMLTAPDELTTGVVFVTMPEAPFVPGELRKKLSLGIFCCYAGDPDRGEAVLASLRRIGPPLADLVRPTPYVDIQQSIDALNPPGRLNYWRSENLSELPDEAIDTLTHYARNVTSPFSYVTLEPKGGAIARVDADDTALSVRDMAYAYYALAVWEDPSDDDRHIAWVREFAQAMSPYTMPGMLLNFVMDEGEQRIRSTYGQRQYDRLVALKDKYDLTNIFRHNQNIPPSGRIEKS